MLKIIHAICGRQTHRDSCLLVFTSSSEYRRGPLTWDWWIEYTKSDRMPFLWLACRRLWLPSCSLILSLFLSVWLFSQAFPNQLGWRGPYSMELRWLLINCRSRPSWAFRWDHSPNPPLDYSLVWDLAKSTWIPGLQELWDNGSLL